LNKKIFAIYVKYFWVVRKITFSSLSFTVSYLYQISNSECSYDLIWIYIPNFIQSNCNISYKKDKFSVFLLVIRWKFYTYQLYKMWVSLIIFDKHFIKQKMTVFLLGFAFFTVGLIHSHFIHFYHVDWKLVYDSQIEVIGLFYPFSVIFSCLCWMF